jgi:2-polyprenyl-3-methyl-5-hydroxy-6-metoxy-1,4-benzoquinol methylase
VVFGWPVFSREHLLDYNTLAFRGEGIPETRGYFDRSRVGLRGGSLLRQYGRGLEQIARVVPSGSLLDVGCGIPLFLDLARSAGYDVQGVDSVPEVARIARDDFGIPVRAAPFDRCGLSNGSFDVITMWDFLEHVPDPMAALRQSRRLLRGGGVLFVSAPNYRSALHGIATMLAKLRLRRVLPMVDKLYHFSHVSIWSPKAIELALGRARFSPLARGLDGPDLDRYRLGRTLRVGLTAIDLVGRATGLRSRLWILARAGA